MLRERGMLLGGSSTGVLVVILGSLSPLFRQACLALPSPAIAELRPCTWALKRSGHLELVGFASALRGGGDGERAPPGRTRGAESPAQHAEPSSAIPGPSDNASGGGEIDSEALERIRKSCFAPMTQPLDLSALDVDGGLALEDVALAESALDAMHERRRCGRLVETQITFRDDASAASAVSLVGSWTDWIEAHELAKVDDTTWIIRLSLPLGEHLFKFVVDGRWTLSPDYSVMDEGDKSSGNNMILVSDVPGLEEFNKRTRSHEEGSFFLDKDIKAAGAAHAEDMAIDAAIDAALGTKSPTRRSNLPQSARASLTAGPHEQASTGGGQPDVFGTSGSLPLMSSPEQQKTPASGAQCSAAIADELHDWALMMDGEVSRGGKESMSAARRVAAEEKDAAAAAARAAAARRVQDTMKKEAQKGAMSPSKRREDTEKERLKREKMESERRREQRERARAQRERKRDNARTKAQKQKEELQKSKERQRDTERQRLGRDAARQKEAEEELAELEKAEADEELELALLEKAQAEKERALLEKARAEKELALLEKAGAERELALKAKAESEREPALREKVGEASAASGLAVQTENVNVKPNVIFWEASSTREAPTTAANAELERQNTHGPSDETGVSLDQAARAAALCGEVDQQVVTTAPRAEAVLVSGGSESGQVGAGQAVGNGALSQEVPSTDTAEIQAPAHASLSAHATADLTSQLDHAGAEVPGKQTDSPSAAARQPAAIGPGPTAPPLVDGCAEDAGCQSQGLVVEREKTVERVETVECCLTAWRTAMKEYREKTGAVRCRGSRLGREVYEYGEGLLCQLAQSARDAISVHGGGNSNLVVACSSAGRKAVGVCKERGQEAWSSLGALRHKSVAFLKGQLPDSACLSLSVPPTVARWRHELQVRLAELVSNWQVILSEALGPSFQVNRAEAAVSLLGGGLLLLLVARVVLVLVFSILFHDAHTSPAQGPAFSMLRSYSGRAQGKSSGQRLSVIGDSGSGHVKHPGTSGSRAARSGRPADVLDAPGVRAATAASVPAAEATEGTGGVLFRSAQGWFANSGAEGRAEGVSVPGGADAGVRDSAAGRAGQDERSEMGRGAGGTAGANLEPSIMADLWAAMMHAH